MSLSGLRFLLFGAAIIVALIDQFVLHGTAFKLVPLSRATGYDGLSCGLLLAWCFTYLVKG